VASKHHRMERISFTDDETGARVLQLVSNSRGSENLYFEETPFTPDSRYVIFRSPRSSSRSPRWDLLRADVDGSDLVQLTDRDDLTDAVLSLDGTCIYVTTKRGIHRVDIEDGTEKLIAPIEAASSVNQITICGEMVFAQVRPTPDSARIICYDPSCGDVVEVAAGSKFGHVTGSRTGNWVSWVGVDESNQQDNERWHCMRPDGSDCQRWAVPNWSHTAWAGLTDRMQGTLHLPDCAIMSVAPGESDAKTVAIGPYFWHSSTSDDAEWMVADTNWPNIGLQLIHGPTGAYRTLCRDMSSCGHPERTHPHPVVSPDGDYVLFNSDRTGTSQVYVVAIPSWMKTQLRPQDAV
jgi:oligogalacturonide lyase